MPTPGIKGFRRCQRRHCFELGTEKKQLARRKIEGRVKKVNMKRLEVERIWYAKITANGAGAPDPRGVGKNGRK